MKLREILHMFFLNYELSHGPRGGWIISTRRYDDAAQIAFPDDHGRPGDNYLRCSGKTEQEVMQKFIGILTAGGMIFIRANDKSRWITIHLPEIEDDRQTYNQVPEV